MKNIEEIVELLNDLLKADKVALSEVLMYRTSCSTELADHKEINVRSEGDGSFTVSCLGMLNAIVGHRSDGWGQITIHLSTDGSTIELFSVTKRQEFIND